MNETVDDIIIFATLDSIDGPGGILGQAGPCYIRFPTTSCPAGSCAWLPLMGVMMFDTADVANLESSGKFDEVVFHEMGHVLGFGTVWSSNYLNLLVGPASSGGLDPHFIGTQAVAGFNRSGGTGYSAGAKVPVENTGGAGTRDSHWRKTVFGPELMTGFLTSGVPNPLSVVTVASMGDEGYRVNYAGADPFALSLAAAFLRSPGATTEIHLRDDVLRLPIGLVNERGRLVGVVQPR